MVGKFYMRLYLLFFLLDLSYLFAHLPGRAENETVSFAQFGECKIFFYMTPEKDALCRDLIGRVNEDMIITLGQAGLPCPTHEILLQAIKNPERDPVGTQILEDYALKAHSIAEENLGMGIYGLNWYINLNLNWEALKIHHDHFIHQYEYMASKQLDPDEWMIIQDLSLIDWEMSTNTVAGTMIQDGREGDRYILSLFPGEVVGTFYSEPAKSLPASGIFLYPGQVSMPPHAVISPMDYLGGQTCGSSKGKRMSAIFRGVAQTSEVDHLAHISHEIEINKKRAVLKNSEGLYVYPNGMVCKQLSDKVCAVNRERAQFFREQENLHIETLSYAANAFIANHLKDRFEIDQKVQNPQIFLITKKDSGFSSLGRLDIELPQNARVIAVNFSTLPSGYRYFNLAQDWTKQGRPWIQLFELQPGMAMEIPQELFDKILLSPAEELIYRSEIRDQVNASFSDVMNSLNTQIALFIFNQDCEQEYMNKEVQ